MKLQLFNIACCLGMLLLLPPNTAMAHAYNASYYSNDTCLAANLTGIPNINNMLATTQTVQQEHFAIAQDIHGAQQGSAYQTDKESFETCETESNLSSEKRKSFDITYKVNNSDALNIENKFGKVHVNTWDKNEIKVRIDIIARASSDDKAAEILKNISINERRADNIISIATKMEPMRVSGSASKSFEINYTVYMPTENMLTVKNSFGDVYLASLKGKADITVKYGSLKTDKLSNSDNRVSLAYSSGTCSYINSGNIEVSYSNMNVDATNGLQGFSKFSDFKIGDLRDELNLEVKYGTFKVDQVSKNIRKISLDSGFSPILLNFEDNAAFNFDVNVSFADFKVDKSLVNITHLERKTSNAAYKGKYGNAASKGFVSINSKYGDVKFTK